MKKRTYSGEPDLKLLQDFNAAAIAVTDHCGYLHPGDIPHHIYNGNKHYDPVELMTIWEDDEGIAGWLLVDVGHKSFDAQVRPEFRGKDLEEEIFQIAEARLLELMQKYSISSDFIYSDAFRGDTGRIQVLKDLGWEQDNGLPYVLNRTEINAISVPALPDGFSFRSIKGIEEASALAEVHNAAFGSIWTPDLYRKVMESPGYNPERELVIEAPDGTFVSFCIIWFDHLNSTGLFEPVGTHRNHQRFGFGKALMMYGMQQMAAAGMKFASVAHFGDNVAAKGLYQFCGFAPWHLLDSYSKPIEL